MSPNSTSLEIICFVEQAQFELVHNELELKLHVTPDQHLKIYRLWKQLIKLNQLKQISTPL